MKALPKDTLLNDFEKQVIAGKTKSADIVNVSLGIDFGNWKTKYFIFYRRHGAIFSSSVTLDDCLALKKKDFRRLVAKIEDVIKKDLRETDKTLFGTPESDPEKLTKTYSVCYRGLCNYANVHLMDTPNNKTWKLLNIVKQSLALGKTPLEIYKDTAEEFFGDEKHFFKRLGEFDVESHSVKIAETD